jgi:hypothetical protein
MVRPSLRPPNILFHMMTASFWTNIMYIKHNNNYKLH